MASLGISTVFEECAVPKSVSGIFLKQRNVAAPRSESTGSHNISVLDFPLRITVLTIVLSTEFHHFPHFL